MGKLPQLQVAEAPVPDFSPEGFFERVLPRVLASRRAEARLVGGRYGFIVGERQWIVDLDHGRVRGDRHTAVVADDDGLDVVVRTTRRGLEELLRGRGAAELVLFEGRGADLAPLLIVLAGGFA